MTAFNVAMLLTADATQARRELKGTEAEVQKFGATARQAGTTAAAGFQRAEAEILQFRRASTGATSNLVAQFNDVGQMLAAGQSPLLLAAQQGTQISQVLGPLGAAGAVRALGGAFLGMLNPVNLAVFAAVAGLGILGNSLRELGGETKSVEDAIGDLADATKDWRDAAKVGSDDLLKQFGRITPEIVEMQRQITQLALVETLLKAADAADALSASLDPGTFDVLSTRTGNIADLLGVEERGNDAFQRLTPAVEEFQALLRSVGASDSLEGQIAALDRIQETLLKSAGGFTKMTEEQRAVFKESVALEQQLRFVQAAQEGIGSAQQVSEEKLRSMIAGLEDEARIRDLIRKHGEDSRQVEAARVQIERQSVQEMLAASDASAELKQQFLEAWNAANGAEGSVGALLAGLLDTVGAGDDTKRAIEDAWAAITGAADATNVWTGLMAGVAAEVRGIGAALSALGGAGIANAGKAIELEALRSGKSVADARRAAQEDEFRRDAEINEAKVGHVLAQAVLKENLTGLDLDRQLEAERKLASERDRAAARGASGAGRTAARETGFIAALERELDILRATDPVEKELIRNREALNRLSAEDRAVAEARIVETLRLREQKQVWQDIRGTIAETLDQLIVQGESASEVFANLARTIASAFLQSALLGTGPLSGLFGGAGTGLLSGLGGGLFGGGDLFNNNILGLATGGLITGPGGPTSDSILARLSDGEFVVNAAATARSRPLLEAINSAPRFASGGVVGGAAAPFAPGGGAQPMVIELRLSDDLDARIAETAEPIALRVTRGGLQEYDRKVMPRKVRAVQADPRRVG